VSTIIQEPTNQPSPISFREAFLYWLKLGFISLGITAAVVRLGYSFLIP